MPWLSTLLVRIISAHCQTGWAMVGRLVIDSHVFRRLSIAAVNGDKLFCPQTTQASMCNLCHCNTCLVRTATPARMEKGIKFRNRLHSELRFLISIADGPSDRFITDRQALQKYLARFEFERWKLISSIVDRCLSPDCMQRASGSDQLSRYRLWI
jgi:hypothetical protein